MNREKAKEHANSIGHSTVPHANRVLMKDLVFAYATRLDLNLCYRCNKRLTREDFTIDHVKPWRNKPNSQELFFDVNNIRFSHHSCNSANTAIKKITHGTQRMYNRHRCRCTSCKEAHRVFMQKRRAMGKG